MKISPIAYLIYIPHMDQFEWSHAPPQRRRSQNGA